MILLHIQEDWGFLLFPQGISAQKNQVVIVGANWTANKKNKLETRKKSVNKTMLEMPKQPGQSCRWQLRRSALPEAAAHSWLSPVMHALPQSCSLQVLFTFAGWHTGDLLGNPMAANLFTETFWPLNQPGRDEAFSALTILWLCHFKLRFYNLKLGADMKKLAGRRS